MKTLFSMQEPRLGIDLGGVIIPWRKDAHSKEPYFDQPFLLRPPRLSALERISDLMGVFRGKVWIVSRWAAAHREKTHQWLERHQVLPVTGMSAAHVRFCEKISSKADICAELGITHFIDDRMQVMDVLRPIVPHLYLFGEQGQEAYVHEWLTPVANWDDAYAAVLNDVSKGGGWG